MSGWLVTGAGGMLGRDLVMLLERDGEVAAGYGRTELDITNAGVIRSALSRHRPEVVVNCAAWTAVDDAEAHEDAALQVNGHAVVDLAAACADYCSTLIQVSTDYVFDGVARQPYGEADPPAPRTAYGRGKLAGERAVLDLLADGGSGYIVRTAWLYGAHGRNFVRTMIELERQRPVLDVVDDQCGQPSWTVDVAGQIIALVRSAAASGIYHATSSGETTWFGLAREVFSLLGADPARVRATTSDAYRRPAVRPSYSVLGHDGWAKAGLEPIGDWRPALRRAFPDLRTALAAASPTGQLSGHKARDDQRDLPLGHRRAGGRCRRCSRRTGTVARHAASRPATARRHPWVTGRARRRRASRYPRWGPAGRQTRDLQVLRSEAPTSNGATPTSTSSPQPTLDSLTADTTYTAFRPAGVAALAPARSIRTAPDQAAAAPC